MPDGATEPASARDGRPGDGAAEALPALEARAVSYRYGGSDRAALDDATLVVERGAIVALLGPNGSGKSTLLRLVAQLDAPRAGSIRVLGRSGGAVRALLGVVFQTPALDRRLTVEENLLAAGRLQGLGRAALAARATALLAALDLDDRRRDRVSSLSLGLARRADLCRALLHEPPLLLLDEATAGLDPSSRGAFLDLVHAERERTGLTVVGATHLVDEADRSDRVVLMHRGRIVADGAPEALRRALGPRIAVVHGDPAPGMADGADPRAAQALAWTRRPEGWTADLPSERDAAALAERLAAQGRSFSMAPPSLADLFARVTGDALEQDPAPQPDERRRRRRGR